MLSWCFCLQILASPDVDSKVCLTSASIFSEQIFWRCSSWHVNPWVLSRRRSYRAIITRECGQQAASCPPQYLTVLVTPCSPLVCGSNINTLFYISHTLARMNVERICFKDFHPHSPKWGNTKRYVWRILSYIYVTWLSDQNGADCSRYRCFTAKNKGKRCC